MSGIAIAIGAMVVASIIMVENAHKKLEEWEAGGRREPRLEVIIAAAQEVGPSLFFSLPVVMVGFLPVFTLQAQAGRLFKPLAYTKTFAMLFASLLAVTLTPVLMAVFIRGRIRPEERNPVSWLLHRLYEPSPGSPCCTRAVISPLNPRRSRFRKTVNSAGAPRGDGRTYPAGGSRCDRPVSRPGRPRRRRHLGCRLRQIKKRGDEFMEQKRIVEVFTAGCPACQGVMEMVQGIELAVPIVKSCILT